MIFKTCPVGFGFCYFQGNLEFFQCRILSGRVLTEKINLFEWNNN